MKTKKAQSIEDYIASFPHEVQQILHKVHQTIQENAPDATTTISYQMPTFKLNKNLVHYAAHNEHIGFYPTPSPIIKFKDQLKDYKTSKGAIQFPLDKPIPYDLIARIVKYRVEELKK